MLHSLAAWLHSYVFPLMALLLNCRPLDRNWQRKPDLRCHNPSPSHNGSVATPVRRGSAAILLAALRAAAIEKSQGKKQAFQGVSLMAFTIAKNLPEVAAYAMIVDVPHDRL